MKKLLLLLLLSTFSLGYSQNSLLSFETGESGGYTSIFGGMAAPLVETGTGTNTTKVLKIVTSPTQQVWQGANFNLTNAVTIGTDKSMTIDVLASGPMFFLVKVNGGVAGALEAAAVVSYTGTNTWQTCTFTFNSVRDGKAAAANGTYASFVIHPYWDSAAATGFGTNKPTRTLYVDKIAQPSTTQTPTLGTFTVPSKFTNDAAFNLTAPTSNSNGTFTYTSSNAAVATVNGSTVTIAGAGTTTITATQSASGVYGSTSKTASFVVNSTYATLAATTAVSALLGTTASSGGNVTNEGTSAVTAKGVCWGTTTSPNVALATKTNDGTGTGAFTSSLTGLTIGTVYYVRAYATNTSGTAYGTQVSFTARTNTECSGNSNESTQGSAFTLGYDYTFTTSGTTVTATFKLLDTKTDPNAYAWTDNPGFAEAEMTAGTNQTWSISFTNVAFVTGYVFKIRCKFSFAGGLSVTKQFSYTVGNACVITSPVLTSTAATAVDLTTATANGNISSNGGGSITSYGFYTSTTNGFANGAGTQVVVGTSNVTGAISSNLTGLTSATTYYYKAYATNSSGTTYGTQQSFTTTSLIEPTFSAFTIASKIIGDADFDLTAATSNSAGAITYTSGNTDVATISGITIHIVGVGTSIITATQAANGSYTSGSTSATLTVSTATNTWNGTSWSNGTPTASHNVIFEGNYSVATNITAKTVTVNNNAIVTIPSGNNVTVTGAVTITAPATFTFSNNANLIQDGTTNTNSGNIILKRNSASLLRLDHTLWSSPVGSQNLYGFSPATLTNRFYTYNTTSNSYVTTGLSAATTFTAGKGFAVRAPNDHSSVTPSTWEGTFTGIPNNGTVPFTLDTSGSGFNLVGNPYPSPISATTFLTENSSKIEGTFYFYAHSLPMNANGTFPTGTNYSAWNTGTGGVAASRADTGIPHNILVPVAPTGIIQVGQGFFVKAKAGASGDINFTNAIRVGNNADQFFRTTEIERHRLWLNLTTETGTDINQIAVAYVEGATQNADTNFDGLSFGNVGSMLSSKIDGANYVIQGRSLPFDSNDVVALGFKATAAGNYKIVLTNKDGLFLGNQDVFVRDNFMGIEHNIKVSPYTFASEIGTFDARFQLVYTQMLGIPSTTFTPNSVLVYKNTDGFHVTTNGIVMRDILVYDISGRLIFKHSNINATATVLKGLSQIKQVLLLKIISQENETVTVKAIN